MTPAVCHIIGTLVLCLVPAPSPPAAALQVWLGGTRPYVYVAPLSRRAPVVVLIGQYREPERPARRLDGTLLSEPTQVYRSRLPFGWDRPRRRGPR